MLKHDKIKQLVSKAEWSPVDQSRRLLSNIPRPKSDHPALVGRLRSSARTRRVWSGNGRGPRRNFDEDVREPPVPGRQTESKSEKEKAACPSPCAGGRKRTCRRQPLRRHCLPALSTGWPAQTPSPSGHAHLVAVVRHCHATCPVHTVPFPNFVIVW